MLLIEKILIIVIIAASFCCSFVHCYIYWIYFNKYLTFKKKYFFNNNFSLLLISLKIWIALLKKYCKSFIEYEKTVGTKNNQNITYSS